MRIDCQSHVFPAEYAEILARNPQPPQAIPQKIPPTPFSKGGVISLFKQGFTDLWVMISFEKGGEKLSALRPEEWKK